MRKHDDVVAHAKMLFGKEGIAMQYPSNLSTEFTFAGVDYVVLVNCLGFLALYRVYESGYIKRVPETHIYPQLKGYITRHFV